MTDVAPNDSSVSPPPPAIITTSEAASPESAATGSSARRGGARNKSVRSPTGGHYADPLSPIASTPLKRQRVGKSTPGAADSSVKKHKSGDNSATSTAAAATKDTFLSPRKLMNDYDAEEKQTEAETHEPAECGPPHASDAEPASGDDELFSPVLKPPRATTRTSSTPSPASSAHAKALDAATAFLSSSSTCSEHNDDDDEDNEADEGQKADGQKADDKGEADARDGDEDEDEDDETVYAVGSESGSEASTCDQEFNPFYFMKTLPKYEEIVPSPRAIALPPKAPDAPKISLVLDLDETLVHCSVDDVENPDLQFPVTFNGVEYTVKVKKRPHMAEFLERVAQRFEVVVFTASHRAYAETLLNLLDPHRTLIQHRLYRDDCLDVYGNYLKDLTVLGRDLSKVLLVDNSPHAFGYQVGNGVPIETWYDDESDDELLSLLPFLEGLVDADDVRPIIAQQFQIQKLIDATPDEMV